MPRSAPTGFTGEEFEYYSRQLVLKEFGIGGQRRLKASRVCVVGAGGLGSPILTQLASMGVGSLRIIDRDVVETSNLQRQHLYGVNVLGVPKVEAAEDRLKLLNPFIEVEAMPMSVKPANAERLTRGVDVVVDALDSMNARYALNRACVNLGLPLVHGGVITQVGSASTILPRETACLECFQGNVDDADLPSCAVQGVHPSVIGVIASIQVSETVKILLGKRPALAGKLLFVDLSDLSFEKIQVSRVDSCPVCGGRPEKKPAPLRNGFMDEVCGREGRRVFVFSPDEHQQLDLGEVNRRLQVQGYEPVVKTRLGTTFTGGGIKGSILVSGVTIIEGLEDGEKAAHLRDALIG